MRKAGNARPRHYSVVAQVVGRTAEYVLPVLPWLREQYQQRAFSNVQLTWAPDAHALVFRGHGEAHTPAGAAEWVAEDLESVISANVSWSEEDAPHVETVTVRKLLGRVAAQHRAG